MMSHIDSWQTQMQNVNEQPANEMIQRAQDNINKVTNFQLEVQEQLNDIKERIDTVRQKVKDCIGNMDNFDGFLVGKVNEYLSDFDEQREMMNERLDNDKKYWFEKLKEMTAKKGKFVEFMTEQLEQYQDNCAQKLFAAPQQLPNSQEKIQQSDLSVPKQPPQPMLFDLSKCPLVDLPRFGKTDASYFDFRWPLLCDLQALNLENPPKLIQIKTSGKNRAGLESIQLIFEGGYESILIGQRETSIFNQHIHHSQQNLSDETVMSIKARVNDGYSQTYISSLYLNYQNGQGKGFTSYQDQGGDWHNEKIPLNHVIVGVYGQIMSDKMITNIGFIAMNLSAFNQ